MTKKSSRTRAIQNALARIGMQASPQQVVAGLAEFGIDMDNAQVRQVKVQMLKRVATVEREQVRTPQVERPQVRRPSKVPSLKNPRR